jgi:putative hydrolase of the HAD superfamily
MQPYKHLFFDLDHTLWDFEKNSIASLYTLYNSCQLKDIGIDDVHDFEKEYHIINEKMWAAFRQGTLTREDLRWKRMNKTLQHYNVYNEPLAKEMSELYLEILPTQTHLVEGCIEVLNYCKDKKYELHLITNGFEKTQHQKLANANLQSYFKEMITSEEAMSMKPKKEIFDFALKKTSALLNESIMIGDDFEADIIGAMNANMNQVYFNPSNKEVRKEPTHNIQQLVQLLDIL